MIPQKFEYIYSITYFRKSITYQHSIKTEPKFKEYNRKVYTCGNRNSYSKTDIDATFMRMKEDAMKNGQLKPAYNVQHGVDAGYESVKTIYICEDCSNCNYKSQCIKGKPETHPWRIGESHPVHDCSGI